ncbi:polyprenyl synthetase family protein [Candidatus Oleimmundimicrobium sp.]|uniref:polyprenyl synthetase family protein n=1 Tax=Candidatus Oleimmundimicrobium sp. TaxID=3060597 RepID=UPI0027173766|nr:polyprenyl synthetase family protein [Candidatus Oleimmundimicrobium sp.]MDO8885579.1 polyprenyl synthetase family protein [Candidatus Oleimmundimicrobium sp.]
MSKGHLLPLCVKEDLKQVEDELTRVVSSKEGKLAEAALTTLKAGGKRLRPILVLLAGMINLYDASKLIHAAVAVELVHTASLIHDDVLDGADTRRGSPTINAAWNKKTAVSAGDYLFGIAFEILSKLDNPYLMKVMSEAVLALSVGELHQMRTRYSLNQTMDDYLAKIKSKTAVLFSTACLIGATLSEAKKVEIEALGRYGENLGMAFQIYDDVLDISGDKKVLGKPIGIDLKDGMVTMPVFLALKETPQRAYLQNVVENVNLTEEEIKKAIEIIEATSAIKETKRRAKGFVEKALGAIELIENDDVRGSLCSIGEFVIDRYH